MKKMEKSDKIITKPKKNKQIFQRNPTATKQQQTAFSQANKATLFMILKLSTDKELKEIENSYQTANKRLIKDIRKRYCHLQRYNCYLLRQVMED